MENNKNKKTLKFQGDMLNFYDFIQVFVFTTNNHLNRLGGLSLPRKSVVWLTDRPDMTSDVYRGRKTTKQQQQQLLIYNVIYTSVSVNFYGLGSCTIN